MSVFEITQRFFDCQSVKNSEQFSIQKNHRKNYPLSKHSQCLFDWNSCSISMSKTNRNRIEMSFATPYTVLKAKVLSAANARFHASSLKKPKTCSMFRILMIASLLINSSLPCDLLRLMHVISIQSSMLSSPLPHYKPFTTYVMVMYTWNILHNHNIKLLSHNLDLSVSARTHTHTNTVFLSISLILSVALVLSHFNFEAHRKCGGGSKCTTCFLHSHFNPVNLLCFRCCFQ